MHRLPLPTALAALLAGTWLLATPSPAGAEGFLDLRLGAAFTRDGNIDYRADSPVLPGASFNLRRRADYDTGPSAGLRGGYWFEGGMPSFLGIGLDLSYYQAFEDSSRGELDVLAFPLSPLLMVRVPIASSDEIPGGRVQPYGAIGPAFTLSLARAELDDLGVGLDEAAAASFDVGLDVRGGLAIQVAKPIALFAEYRFTYLEPEFEDDDVDFFGGPDVDVEVEPELRTHHLTFGVSFRF